MRSMTMSASHAGPLGDLCHRIAHESLDPILGDFEDLPIDRNRAARPGVTYVVGLSYGDLALDLGVEQVATGIRLPVVARGRLGARAEVAVADRQPPAGRAASLQQRLARAQSFEELDPRVAPDLRERPLADRADRMVRRELIGMHDAEAVDAADGDAGAIAAVVADQRERVFGARGLRSSSRR